MTDLPTKREWPLMRRWPEHLARKALIHYAKGATKKELLKSSDDPWEIVDRLMPSSLTFVWAIDGFLPARIIAGEGFAQLEVASGLTEKELYEAYPGIREERIAEPARQREKAERKRIMELEDAERARIAAEVAEQTRTARMARIAKAATKWRLTRLPPERTAEIVRLRGTGLSYRKIGDHFNLSAETIRQILERNTRIINGWHARDKERIKGRVIDMGGRRDVWLTFTPEQTARELGLI